MSGPDKTSPEAHLPSCMWLQGGLSQTELQLTRAMRTLIRQKRSLVGSGTRAKQKAKEPARQQQLSEMRKEYQALKQALERARREKLRALGHPV